MWLLEARSRSLVYFADERQVHGKYAIVSHTWLPGEVSFQDIEKPDARHLPGYTKINYACLQAERDGLKYVWIDTCCIDKTSSAELSEAINSMFRWYYHAAICYAYLADIPTTVPGNEQPRRKLHNNAGGTMQRERELQGSRWFQRCWTLQELVSSDRVIFYNRFWGLIGDKAHLVDELCSVTGIDASVLIDRESIFSLPVARRLSWASRRSATRIEDEAYSLLGILNVSMPMLYGEGRKAFVRLQEEFIKSSTDQSIFAWDPWIPSHFGLLLSPAPFGFRNGRYIESHLDIMEDETYEMTNKGFRISLPTWDVGDYIVAVLNCRNDSHSAFKPYTMRLRNPQSLGRNSTRAKYIVCEVDRMAEEQLSPRVGYEPEHNRVWRDLMIVREGSTATITVEPPPGVRIFGAHPEINWRSGSLQFQLRNDMHAIVSWGYFIISHFESQQAALLCFGRPSSKQQQTSSLRVCWSTEISRSRKKTLELKIEYALFSSGSKVARMQLGDNHYAYATPVLRHYVQDESQNVRVLGEGHIRGIGNLFADSTWTISISVYPMKSTTIMKTGAQYWPFHPRAFEIAVDLLFALPKELWKPSLQMKSAFVTLPSNAKLYYDFGQIQFEVCDIPAEQTELPPLSPTWKRPVWDLAKQEN